MPRLLDSEFIHAIESLKIEDAPLARRMIKGRLDKYMPESIEERDAIDEIYRNVSGRDALFCALCDEELIEELLDKQGLSESNYCYRDGADIASYLERSPYDRSNYFSRYWGVEQFVRTLTRENEANYLEYYLRTLHRDIRPLILLKIDIGYTEMADNIVAVLQRTIEEMEEPQKSVLRLMLNRNNPPKFEEVFTLLESISLQDEYALFERVEGVINSKYPEHQAEVCQYLLKRYAGQFSNEYVAKRLFWAIDEPYFNKRSKTLEYIEAHWQDIYSIKFGSLDPRFEYSEEDQSTLYPSPIRIRCNNYFALGEQHPEFLDKMLAAMSKNPYVKDYMEQICQRELANTGLSKEAFAVLEKWEAEAQGKGKNEHGNGANDLNDIVEYISKCIFDKFGNYKTEREKIHRFCEKHKDDEQYEYYVAQVLKAMVTRYKAIEKEKKQKKNRAMQRLHVTFSPLGEVLAGFFAAGNPNLLYQYLGSISDEFLCIAKNTYSDSAYKFSEACYIRRQQQRYLSDDMMTATCRILFADESITGDTILEKMRNPLPESVKAWGKDAFGCCRLALLNMWRSDSVPATEITKLRLELFENRKRMPITNETVSTIEELYATDEENGWLALASTFRKKEFYEDSYWEDWLDVFLTRLGVKRVGQAILRGKVVKTLRSEQLMKTIKSAILSGEYEIAQGIMQTMLSDERISENELSKLLYNFTISPSGRNLTHEQANFLSVFAKRLSKSEESERLRKRAEKMCSQTR